MTAMAAESGRAAQVGEDGEHAAVGVRVGVEAELVEDLLDVGFDGALGDEQAGSDGPVRESLANQNEHLALTPAELIERVSTAFTGEEPGDDRGVDDSLPVAEATEGVDQVRDVEDAFFEKVADPFGMLFEQPHCVMRLDVLGEDQHADARMFGADLLGGDEAFVGMCGGHPDIDNGGAGLRCADRSQQRGGVTYLVGHIYPPVGGQPGDALAGEHHILGHDYPHGTSARHTARPVDKLPPSAPTRSAAAPPGEAPPDPLSSAVTTSRPPSCTTVTVACPAPRRAASPSASATAKYAAASTGSGHRSCSARRISTGSGAVSARRARAGARPAPAHTAG